MNLEDFKDALDNHGIKYRESGASIHLEQCPACGSKKYKVLLRVRGVDESEPFFGRCLRGSCLENYSSIKYLIMMEIDRAEVLRIHGLNPQESLNSVASVPEIKEVQKEEDRAPEPEVDTSSFIDFSVWKDHPAAVYGHRRGITEHQYNTVAIDPDTNSVVFLIKNSKGGVIGWQKRFVSPTNPKMKTKTLSGFQINQHVLEFPNLGKPLLICEGPFTAISAWHYGFHGVCTFGSNVSKEQLKQIEKIAKNNNVEIGVAVERDTAGSKNFNSIRSHFFWNGVQIFKVTPVAGTDINDSWMAGEGINIDKISDWSGPAIPDLNLFMV